MAFKTFFLVPSALSRMPLWLLTARFFDCGCVGWGMREGMGMVHRGKAAGSKLQAVGRRKLE